MAGTRLPWVSLPLLSVNPIELSENVRMDMLKIIVAVRLSVLELSQKSNILSKRQPLLSGNVMRGTHLTHQGRPIPALP